MHIQNSFANARLIGTRLTNVTPISSDAVFENSGTDLALFAASRANYVKIDGITEDLGATSGRLGGVLSADGSTPDDAGSKTKPYGRGWIKASAKPTADGMRIKVDSYHKNKNEKIQLTLQVRVINDGKEQLITLGVLNSINDKLNGKYYEATNYFDVKYDDINAYLAKNAPHLKVQPGTTLAVNARWTSGHEWGGYARNGMFDAPRPTGHTTALAVRTGGGAIKYDDVPLDIAVPVDDPFYKAFKEVVKKDSKLTTRLECEYKGATTEAELENAVKELYNLSKNPSEFQKVLGRDWSIEPITRYYLKDDKGNVLTDDRGFPKIDPMEDTYYDSPSWSITKRQGALRVRSNKQKAGSLNVKPGAGKLDPKTGISKRVEIGLDLRRGFSMDRLSDLFTSDEFYNPFREMEELDGRIRADKVLQPAIKIIGDRHKFKLTNNKTGVEIEVSCDFTKAHTLRDEDKDPTTGLPREVEHFQVEMEIDHLQINSTNVVSAGASAASKNYSKFRNENDQADYLKALKPSKSQVNAGRPRIHTLEDLENPNALKEEKEELGIVQAKIISHLFPKGMQPATQKAHMAAEMMGLV